AVTRHIDVLNQGRRGAGRIVGVAAVARRYRVAAHTERRRRERRRTAGERCGADLRAAIEERHRAGRRKPRHRRRERHRLPGARRIWRRRQGCRAPDRRVGEPVGRIGGAGATGGGHNDINGAGAGRGDCGELRWADEGKHRRVAAKTDGGREEKARAGDGYGRSTTGRTGIWIDVGDRRRRELRVSLVCETESAHEHRDKNAAPREERTARGGRLRSPKTHCAPAPEVTRTAMLKSPREGTSSVQVRREMSEDFGGYAG